jgi:hypothetical protein
MKFHKNDYKNKRMKKKKNIVKNVKDLREREN